MPPFKTMVPTNSRPNEWKIEQGLSGAELPVIDMTEPENKSLIFQTFPTKFAKDEEAIKSVGDPEKLFVRERDGWIG
jgi:sulfite oxidase